ncbi:MAG TPA: MBL fold metallo-hydrolase [Nitrososphaerales archaeon]|nr:MBL fold metallo-hydrolase [Nitrososphaerales archaeon]
MELFPALHQIEGVGGANSFLVISDLGVAVIDTGLPGNEKKIVEYARKLGIEPSKISYIILTHPDIDHSGSAAKLKSLTGAKVAIHELDAMRLSGEKKLKEVKGPMGLLFGAMGPFMRFTPVNPDVMLKDSDKLLDLAVVHTPGHTEGSISLYRDKAAIFVGDALRTNSAGKPILPPGPMTVDMDQAKESIRKISTLQYALLLPGHGPPITKDASASLASFVKRGFK